MTAPPVRQTTHSSPPVRQHPSPSSRKRTPSSSSSSDSSSHHGVSEQDDEIYDSFEQLVKDVWIQLELNTVDDALRDSIQATRLSPKDTSLNRLYLKRLKDSDKPEEFHHWVTQYYLAVDKMGHRPNEELDPFYDFIKPLDPTYESPIRTVYLLDEVRMDVKVKSAIRVAYAKFGHYAPSVERIMMDKTDVLYTLFSQAAHCQWQSEVLDNPQSTNWPNAAMLTRFTINDAKYEGAVHKARKVLERRYGAMRWRR